MTGRHREGRPYSLVYRRVWDGPARAEAERLGQVWSEWTVFYSLSKRSFHAVASWDGPQLVMVEDATTEGVEERMREAEMARLVQAATPSPARRDSGERPSTEGTAGKRRRGGRAA
ncbi:hypothetical protein [Streptosporangium saharense]|uniref:hypothetical protein n=1 Tax=Streptosporangium saharense TaxID=1706840 RepID=UPI0034379AC1